MASFPPSLQIATVMDAAATAATAAVSYDCNPTEPPRTPTNTWEILDSEFRRMLAPVSDAGA